MERLTPFASPIEALRFRARRDGSRVALRFPHEDAQLDFAGWLARAEALARGLFALGLAEGAHVALLAENRIAWPVVQLGVAAAGMVLVPLNTHYREDDLAGALAASGAQAIVLSPRFRRHRYLEMVRDLQRDLPTLKRIIVLDPVPGELSLDAVMAAGDRSSAGLPAVEAETLASLLFTSGTTGVPKGALLSHGGTLANAWGTAERLRLGPADRWTSMIPLFHCAGCIMSILGTLQIGATYVGVPTFEPDWLARVIAGERCTLLSGVPTAWLALRDLSDPPHTPSLRGGTCGGADCDPQVLADCAERFGAPGIVQVYGQTEASTLVSCPDVEDPERFETAGRPLRGMAVRVVDPQTNAVLAPGAVGEVQARGPMVMRGYHARPDATAETITADGWLRTGDLGALTPEGRLRLAGGRLRDMIIRGGENIYPVEIEAVLARHPAVAEVAVFGMRDAYYGEIVAAALRPRTAAEGLSTALAAYCAARIARFKVPVRWFAVTSFPLTASGKIRKTELRALAEAGQLEPL